MNRADEVKVNPGGATLGTQPAGAAGTISEGPKTEDGLTWWKVDYGTGTDGWVSQNRLTLAQTGAVQGASTTSLEALLRQFRIDLQNLLNTI
jgi:hypothetical protein